MAFCTNCGAQLPDGSKFCTSCGAKFEAPKPAEETQHQPGAPAQESAPVQGTYQPAQQSYTPPTQQSYTPPTQQSYTPPTQQSYTPPTQQSYTPPMQQNAAAQAACAPAAKTPKQKQPLNTKTLFIIGGAALAVILAVVLILVLGGKGNTPEASNDPNVGVWNAATASMWGMDMAVSDIFANGVSLELKDNGKCVLTVDGDAANGKWSCEDGALSVTGGGIDCTGSIEGGVLTLTNLMDMGVDLTFEKEGGYSAGAATGDGSGTNAQLPSGTGSASELQKQWNGTWYGCMYVNEATGEVASYDGSCFDAYMVVDVDAEGKGTFAVYMDGSDEAFALANCEATASGLNAIDGTVAGGTEMYAYNWMFLPMPDYPDQYTMGDAIEDGSNTLDFTLFMKQWGGSWQKEVDSDFAIVPPSIDRYNTAIANGELPPYGFAPPAYSGSGSSSLSGSSSVSFSGPTETYDYFDKIFITYPSDTFFRDENAILDTIAAKDESVKLSIVVQISEQDHDATMEYYDSYSTYEQYSSEDMTIAGYEARRITYIDMWGDYVADVHVNFGKEINGNYGVNFSITSTKSMEACTSDVVMSILNTLTVAE